MSTTKLSRSQLEIDYLRFVGKLVHFDSRNPNHRQTVLNYLDKHGFLQTKNGPDWVLYENKELGTRAFFSNYPMNNKMASRMPSLQFDFTGHFFIHENADLLCRKMIKYFTKKFGTLFKINRVDIRQDIYNAYYPFDYLPDWTDHKKGHIWALRGNPTFTTYNNNFTSRATGLRIQTSRYNITSYNRMISLNKKFRNGEVSKRYFNYYKSIYKGRHVQRLEIQLKQDACKLFSLLFFKKDYDKDKLLKYTISNFGRNHALKDFEYGKPINKMPTNSTFSELFYLDQKDEVKNFKIEFHQKTGLRFSDVTFSDSGRNINEIVKMLARKICELSKGQKEVMYNMMDDALKSIKTHVEDFKFDIVDRVMAFNKTVEQMDFNLADLLQAKKKIYEEKEKVLIPVPV